MKDCGYKRFSDNFKCICSDKQSLVKEASSQSQSNNEVVTWCCSSPRVQKRAAVPYHWHSTEHAISHAKVAFLGWGNQVAGNVLSGAQKDQTDEAACHLHLKAKVVDVWSPWMSGQFASTGGCAWKEVPRPTASSPQIFAMVDPFVLLWEAWRGSHFQNQAVECSWMQLRWLLGNLAH